MEENKNMESTASQEQSASRKEQKSGNGAITFLDSISTSFKAMKLCMVLFAAVCVAVCLGVSISANRRAEAAAKNIYVIDQGSVLEAFRADNGEQRDLEVMDHVTRFHELFYNLAPNINMINQNVNKALNMADRSVYDYYSDLKASKYYSRLIDINAMQYIEVDSIHVDVMRYPHPVETFATLIITREQTSTLYSLRTQCYITDVERTRGNPHGMMISKFYASKPELIKR